MLKCPFDGPFTALTCPFDGPFTALKCPFQMAPCPFENLGRKLSYVCQQYQGSTLAMCPLFRMHFLGRRASSGHNNSFYTGPRGQWIFVFLFFFFSSCTWSLAHSAANHRASCTEHARAHAQYGLIPFRVTYCIIKRA